MPNNDLPVTLDEIQNPAGASHPPQGTTTPETEASAQATPALDLRGYELSERLGGGGMGDVYRSGDPALGRDLAIKVMKAELQGYAAAEQRFLREARVTGSLQHPGIVPIYNLGRLADGRLHYTMRLVRGRTFADILKDEAGQAERLPALLAIFEKICQAVAYAHSKQVLHRDLKPANVMVGRFGEVQVMDWGLAKVLTATDDPVAAEERTDGGGTRIHTADDETPPELTRLGREMGTPAYMPPEQARGEWATVDERADVFSLGAMLCEILTSQPPYSGGDVLRKAKHGDLVAALERVENCGREATLLGLCRDCLASARQDRPRDAEQVARRMAAYQSQVQERLRRAELERAAAAVQVRWERKRRHWIMSGALLALVGAAVSTWLAVRAKRAEGQAMTAADVAREAKDLAQTRLRQIETAYEVSNSIFRDLDPRTEEKGGPSLRQQLSQHLQRAATQLDEGAIGDSMVVARLQATLGYSLVNLGQAKMAIELLSKAGKTLEAELGSDSSEALTSRNNLALAYLSAGLIDEAVRLHKQTLKQLEARLGSDHPATVTSRNNLAEVYRAAGRIDEAIHLFEQTLKQREATLGTEHPDTLISRNNLAEAYRAAGRTDEAIRLHEQTLKRMEAKLGSDHLDTLSSRHNLALTYGAAGHFTKALALHEQTYKQFKVKLGTDHPYTLQSRNSLATAYSSAGRTDEAIQLFEEILRQREAKLGTEHPDTLISRNNLAEAYRVAGRIDEAIRLHEQTLKQRVAKLGDDHPETLGSRNNLALALWSAGRAAEAIRLYEQNLKQMEAKLGSDHPDTLTSRSNLALAFASAGRTDEAIRLYEKNLEQMDTKLGATHPQTLSSMAHLGLAYREVGRLKDSIALLETALQRGRQRPSGLPASLSRLPDSLAETYERDGQLTKAEAIYRDSLEQAQRQFGSDDLRTAGTLVQLSTNLLKQKKFKDAEPLLRQCLRIREAKQPDEWTTFNTRSTLGQALLGLKKYADAEPLLLQGFQGMKQRQDKIPHPVRQLRLREALERLVQLYESKDQRDKAADWRKKLQERKAAKKETKS